MIFIIYLTLGFFLTLFGIRVFLQWSKKKRILDIPNERSSHQTPTPVGGGLVIVLVSLSLFVLFSLTSGKTIPWSYFTGALLIATVSWLDDLYSIPSPVRFFCHSLAAVFVIANLGIAQQIYIPLLGNIQFGTVSYIIWFLWIVWMINAYNFMDGIDGIAGIQAITAGIGWAFIGYLKGVDEIVFFAGLLVVINLAFLIYNWQPAKIFMGDVGSAFLGYTFAVLPLLLLEKNQTNPALLLIISILLVWFFVFDTVQTFLRRLVKREAVWKAHRSHIYQKLVIRGFSHQFVSIVYGGMAVLITVLAISALYLGLFNDLLLSIIVVLVSAALSIFTFYNKNNSSEA